MGDADSSRKLFEASVDQTVAMLDCDSAFAKLTAQEKLYAHHIAMASFEGSKVQSLVLISWA